LAELDRILELADRYAGAGRWADVVAIADVLSDELMAQYGEIPGVEDALGEALFRCEGLLLRALGAQPDLPVAARLSDQVRADLLAKAFAIWRVLSGGLDAAYEGSAFVFAAGSLAPEPPPQREDPLLYEPFLPFEGFGLTQWRQMASVIPGLDEDLDDLEDALEEEVTALATGTPLPPPEGDDLDALRLAETLRAAATPKELATVEGWLTPLIEPGKPGNGARLRRNAVLERHVLRTGSEQPDEALLAAYKEAELWPDAIIAAVGLGRLDEAEAMAAHRITAARHVLGFANLLKARPDAGLPRAIRFIEDRLWEMEGKNERDDEEYRSWLAPAYRETGQADKALEIELQRFAHRKDHQAYADAKAAAKMRGQPFGRWEEVRPKLLKEMEKAGSWPALIEAHLDEKHLDEALKALARFETSEPKPATNPYAYAYGYGYGDPYSGNDVGSYRIKVAKAAEKEMPEEAIRLYRAQAEQEIEYRGRDRYRRAADHLGRVKALLEKQGRAEEWKTVIGDIREKNKRLRALKEELDAAGLK
jgi:hypothetical protein